LVFIVANVIHAQGVRQQAMEKNRETAITKNAEQGTARHSPYGFLTVFVLFRAAASGLLTVGEGGL
jgi:hypothetical protein